VNRYRLVIFDMDGTLSEEILDFEAIRQEIGVDASVGILEHLATLPDEARTTAQTILDRHENAAAETCGVHDGAAPLLAEFKRLHIHTALLTRNSLVNARTILSRHQLLLDHVSTREDRPHKPHADSILNITRRFDIPVEQTLMVGDYIYDLQAAQAAGADSALLCLRDGGKRPEFAGMATYCVDCLMDLLPLVTGGEKARS
jgi:phosphoglycolate phosphatase-like HAD superfamily hydrolase